MNSDGISLILDVSLSGYPFLGNRFPNVPYFKLRTSMIHSFIESVSLYVEQKYAYDGAFIFQNELGELLLSYTKNLWLGQRPIMPLAIH